MRPRVATLGLLTLLTTQTLLAGPNDPPPPETIDLTGTVRDFQRSHVDFDVMPIGGPGHYAANVSLTLGGDEVPAFSGEGFKVADEWRNSSYQPIAPHLFASGGAGVVELVEAPQIYDNPTIDTYDSSLPYGGDNVGPPVSFVTGADMPVVDEPTGLPTWVEEWKVSGNGTTLLDYDIHCDKFEISNYHKVWVSGNVTILAEELFKVQNHTKLELLPGATLEIYVKKDAEIENNVDVNVYTTDPSRMLIYNLGVEEFILKNYVDVYARVIAPDGGLLIENNGDLFGSYTGKTFHIKNSGGFHVDTLGTQMCGVMLNDTDGTAGLVSDAAVDSSGSFAQWYTDVLGVCWSLGHVITLIRDNAGIYEYLDDSFYPLDGLLFGNEGDLHNNFFTYAVEAQFEYSSCAGQFIEFMGADDFWLFIDGAMVIDLGGIAATIEQVIQLDRLGLQDGDQYTVSLFYAQRAAGASKFNLRTNIELWSDDIVAVTSAFD